jgi:LPXTG-site transpeptidase (sortase) family protein
MAYAATDVWLEIPKLGVKMSIMGAPRTKTGWDALNKPGPFIGLIDLQYGDQVKVHAFGYVYTYEVASSSLISPSDTKSAFKHKEKSWLTLITCENYNDKTKTYGNRRLVRAVLINVTKEK